MGKRLVVVSAKVEPEYAKELAKVAKARGITKSQLLRDFAVNSESFYRFLDAEKLKHKEEAVALIDAFSQKILERMPEDMRPEWLDFLSDVFVYVAQLRRNEEEKQEVPEQSKRRGTD